jgi:hypothetical protein
MRYIVLLNIIHVNVYGSLIELSIMGGVYSNGSL